MIILGDQISAEIQRQLDEDEVQAIGHEIARITNITNEQAGSRPWTSSTRCRWRAIIALERRCGFREENAHHRLRSRARPEDDGPLDEDAGI